jgi:hypothetical protein
MLGRIIKTVANEYLRRRHVRTGSGPRRMPPTSMREVQHRVVHGVVRRVLDRFMRR